MATSENNLEFFTSIFGTDEVIGALQKLDRMVESLGGSASDAAKSLDDLSVANSDLAKIIQDLSEEIQANKTAVSENTAAVEKNVAAVEESTAAITEFADATKIARNAVEETTLANDAMSVSFKKTNIEAATASGHFGNIYKSLNTIERMGTPQIMRAANWVGLGGLAVGYESVKKFMSYNNAVLQSITQAGVPLSEQKGIFQNVLEISRQTGQNADDIANSFYRVASALAGTHTGMKQMLADTKAISEFNILGNIPKGAASEQSARVVMAAVNAHLRGSPSNVNGVVAALNAIIGSGDIRAQDLISAFGRGGLAVAKVNGLSLADMGAAIDTLTTLGAGGSAAGTSAARAVQLLFSPTSQGAKGLSMVGLGYNSLQEAEKKGGLPAAIEDLKQHLAKFDPFINYPKYKGAGGPQGAINQLENWFGNQLPAKFIQEWSKGATSAGGLNPQQEQQILSMMLMKMFGGSRSSGTVASFIEFIDRMQNIRTSIESRSGIANEQRLVKIAENSPSRVMQRVQANIMADLIQIGQKLTPIALSLAKGLEGFLNIVDKNKVVLRELVGVLLSIVVAATSVRIASLGKGAFMLAGAYEAKVAKAGEKIFGKIDDPNKWSNARKLYEAKHGDSNLIFKSSVEQFSVAVNRMISGESSGGFGGGSSQTGKGWVQRRFGKPEPAPPSESEMFGPGFKGYASIESYVQNESGEYVPRQFGSAGLNDFGGLGPAYGGGYNPEILSKMQLAKIQSNLGSSGFDLSHLERAQAIEAEDRQREVKKTLSSIEANADVNQASKRLDRNGFILPNSWGESIVQPSPATWDNTNQLESVENFGSGSSTRVLANDAFKDGEKELKWHSKLLGSMSGGISKMVSAFSSSGVMGKVIGGLSTVLGGPIGGALVGTLLPVAMPALVSGIGKLVSWLNSNSSSQKTTKIATNAELEKQEKNLKQKIKNDLYNVAHGVNVLNSANDLGASQAMLALDQGRLKQAGQYYNSIGTGISMLSYAASKDVLTSADISTGMAPNLSKYLKGVDPSTGKSYKSEYLKMYDNPKLSVYAANTWISDQLSAYESQIKSPKALALLKKVNPLAAAQVDIAGQLSNSGIITQVQNNIRGAGKVTDAGTAAITFASMMSQAVDLQGQYTNYMAQAKKYGLNTATGQAYLSNADTIKQTIAQLTASEANLSKKFKLDPESVKAIAAEIGTANAAAFQKLGITPGQFEEAVANGVTASASSLAVIVNRINKNKLTTS